MPSEFHEAANGGESRRGRGRRGGGEDEAEEADMFEEKDKDFKKEKGIKFVSEDFNVAQALNGETMRTSARERTFLENLASGAVNLADLGTGDGNMNDGPEGFYQRWQAMAQGDKDDDAFDNGGSGRPKRPDPGIREHMDCVLCDMTSSSGAKMDSDTWNSLEMMMDIKSDKIGYAHNVAIFRHMRDAWNTNQTRMRDRGEKNVRFLSTAEIRNHYLMHDTTDPLLLMNEQVTYLRDASRRARRSIFGRADGREFWNYAANKEWLKTQKQYKDFLLCFAAMRAHMNSQPTALKMRAPLSAALGTGKVSRHMVGAPQRGRYTSEFIK